MKNLIFIIVSYSVFFSGCKEETVVPSFIPKNINHRVVYDNSNLFTEKERDLLIDKIVNYEKKSTNQAAILTLDSIPKNMDILYFSTKVAESWGIGTKEKNNGLLITISKYDNQVAISTGLGTEKKISDHECKVVIDSVIIPKFRKDEFYNGINNALDSLFLIWD